MTGSVKEKTILHGDTIRNFKSVELFAFIKCYGCGEKKGPYPIRKPQPLEDPFFDYEMEDLLGKDAGLVRAVVGGEKDNEIYEWVCLPCTSRHNFQF